MRFLLFLNGEINDFSYINPMLLCSDFIIAVDGGLKYIDKLGIKPNLLIGDFDSATWGLLKKYSNIDTLEYPSKKDFTDLELAISFAIEQGATEIILFGALGGRIDHAMANIYSMIKPIKKGIKTWICADNEDIFLINADAEIELFYKKGTILSLLPLTLEVLGINTLNLEYTLINAALQVGTSLGLSNIFTDEKAEISVTSGILAIIVNKK